LQEQGALAEARAAWDAAVRADPKYAPAWRARAEFRRKSDPKGALRDVNRALKLDPHDPNAYLLRGLIRRDMDRPKDSLADIERANALDPYWVLVDT
jgi:tetratricopeptide (TPR) repeat protein